MESMLKMKICARKSLNPCAGPVNLAISKIQDTTNWLEIQHVENIRKIVDLFT